MNSILSLGFLLFAFTTSYSQLYSCQNWKHYKIVVKDNPDASSNLNVVNGTQLTYSLRLPSEQIFNNYVLDGTKKFKNGFELSVEFGSRYFFHKTFIFVCRNRWPELVQIKVDSFDKANPQEKGKYRNVLIRPRIPINRFILEKYLTNP